MPKIAIVRRSGNLPALSFDTAKGAFPLHAGNTQVSPQDDETGFDEKGKNMYRIYMVPPIDEGDLCAVAIMKWAL